MQPAEHDASKTVRARAAQGHRSTLITQGIRLVCKAASVLIVARLVTPADQGLFAMATSVSLLLWMFRDLGLGMAAVQAPALSDDQCAALFKAQLGIGATLMLLTALSGPLVAKFYQQPELAPLLLSISPSFLLIGLAGLPRVLMMRSLRYPTLNRIETTAALISTVCTVAAAAAGAGAYAFVLFQVMTELIWTILAWICQPWKPARRTKRGELSSLRNTGQQLAWFQALSYAALQIETVGVGQFLGAHVLGLYNRASQMLTLPVVHIAEPLSSVSLSALSRLAGNRTDFKEQACDNANKIAYLALPLPAVVIAMPGEFVQIVLGQQWLEAAPLLRWLGVSAAMTHVLTITQSIAIASQGTRQLLATAIITLPVMAAAVLAGLGHGATGVAIAVAAGNALLFFPRVWWRLRGSAVGTADFTTALAGPFVTACLIAGGAALGRLASPSDQVLQRLICALAGAVLLLAAAGLASRRLRSEWTKLWQTLPIVGRPTKPPSS